MNTAFTRIFAIALAAALSACTWVELIEEGEAVAVMAKAPASCKRLRILACQGYRDASQTEFASGRKSNPRGISEKEPGKASSLKM